jgi:hypothetical protein
MADLAAQEGHLRPKFPTAEAKSDETKEPRGKEQKPPMPAEVPERPSRCFGVYTRSEKPGFVVLTVRTVRTSGTTVRRTEVAIASDPRLADLLRKDSARLYDVEYDAMGLYPPTGETGTADVTKAKEGAGRRRRGPAPRQPRMCETPGCGKIARYGGVPGLCIGCGGGERCKKGCGKSAVGGTGLCVKCGGGVRCKNGCGQSAQGGTGLCVNCGGGVRCKKGCGREAVGGGVPGLCTKCGGGVRCKNMCGKSAHGGTGLCIGCGGGVRCKNGCGKSAFFGTYLYRSKLP